LGGVVSDRILHRTGDRTAARRNVIVAGMLGGFLFLIPVMLVHDVNVAAISLAAAFFVSNWWWRRSGQFRWILRQDIPDPRAA
jgi:Flp pilus assembly protein TadB